MGMSTTLGLGFLDCPMGGRRITLCHHGIAELHLLQGAAESGDEVAEGHEVNIQGGTTEDSAPLILHLVGGRGTHSSLIVSLKSISMRPHPSQHFDTQ